VDDVGSSIDLKYARFNAAAGADRTNPRAASGGAKNLNAPLGVLLRPVMMVDMPVEFVVTPAQFGVDGMVRGVRMEDTLAAVELRAALFQG
jgi:hypothetical protein